LAIRPRQIVGQRQTVSCQEVLESVVYGQLQQHIDKGFFHFLGPYGMSVFCVQGMLALADGW
jgi:hypothetical protein